MRHSQEQLRLQICWISQAVMSHDLFLLGDRHGGHAGERSPMLREGYSPDCDCVNSACHGIYAGYVWSYVITIRYAVTYFTAAGIMVWT